MSQIYNSLLCSASANGRLQIELKADHHTRISKWLLVSALSSATIALPSALRSLLHNFVL
jgi:hypothetical protein